MTNMQSRPPDPKPGHDKVPEFEAATSLVSAMLLSVAGGSLDAFLYLNHGHVFAGAMTGNMVLGGIALFSPHPANALRNGLSLAAFAAGVWVAELLCDRLRQHAVSVGLTCEAAGLLLCSLLPASFPEVIFIPLISLLAAYQVASFRQADTFTYSSAFITNDLRSVIVGLYQGIQHGERRRRGLGQARELALIVLSFLFGAVVGAQLAPRFGNHTLWLPVIILLMVLGIVLRRAGAARPTALSTTHRNQSRMTRAARNARWQAP